MLMIMVKHICEYSYFMVILCDWGHKKINLYHQKKKKWAVAQFLEIPSPSRNSWNTPPTH